MNIFPIKKPLKTKNKSTPSGIGNHNKFIFSNALITITKCIATTFSIAMLLKISNPIIRVEHSLLRKTLELKIYTVCLVFNKTTY